MNADQRTVVFVVSLFLSGLGFWASVFAGTFIDENRPVMFGLFFFGLAMIMTHAAISAITFDRLSKRVSALEGDPETPPKSAR